jgi:hypothetical protein
VVDEGEPSSSRTPFGARMITAFAAT